MGGRLFDALIQEAKDRGLNGMTWQVLDWNEPAFNFYRKYDARFEAEWVNGILDVS
jgi:GNAT superfamily N-acetyltransferase